VRRLPQRIIAKLLLVFGSNGLNSPDHLGPRLKLFLKLNELTFKLHHAMDLQDTLRIRVEKALDPPCVAKRLLQVWVAVTTVMHAERLRCWPKVRTSPRRAERRLRSHWQMMLRLNLMPTGVWYSYGGRRLNFRRQWRLLLRP